MEISEGVEFVGEIFRSPVKQVGRAEENLRLPRSAIILPMLCARLYLLFVSGIVLFPVSDLSVPLEDSCWTEDDKGGDKASAINAGLCRHCSEQERAFSLLSKPL